MSKLKQLLLAGTLIPALAISLVPASAQAPDDRKPHGQQGGGGPRGEHAGNPGNHPGGGQPGGPRRAETPPNAGRPVGEPHGAGNPNRPPPPAARAQNREEGQPQGGRRGGQDRPRGDAAHRNDGPDSTPRRAGNGNGGNPGEPRGRRDADRQPDHGPNTPNNPAKPQRAQNPDRRDGPGPRNGGPGERRDDRGPRDVGAGERRDGPGPRNGGPAERRDDRGPRDVGAGERRDDRGPRNGGPGERRDDRGPRDVGNGGPRNDNPRRFGNEDRPNDPRGGGGPTVVIGGGAPGFLPQTGARRLDDIRRDRRQERDGNRLVIREPGRTIINQNGRAFIVHDENARFRDLGLNAKRDRRGNEFIDTVVRPGGIQIITYTDVTGRLLRRVRRTPDGREFILIDNGNGGRIQRYEDDVVVLPPPPLRIPRDRYVVDYRGAEVGVLYDTLIAPPLAAPPRRYTLDQVRYSPDVRNYVRSIDINTINFDTGSWDVPASATGQLRALGDAIRRAIDNNPNSVFLIEGYTDATGNPDDNLSLSDRRAQSVAEILTKSFNVPPENLTTQGYGQQNPKEQTDGPSAANRRVVVRNITQLLASGGEPPAGQ